jgi:hypothetical protein
MIAMWGREETLVSTGNMQKPPEAAVHHVRAAAPPLPVIITLTGMD